MLHYKKTNIEKEYHKLHKNNRFSITLTKNAIKYPHQC